MVNADTLKSPIARWTAVITLLGSLSGGVTWAVAKMEAADAKADSALTTAKEVKSGMDMMIQLQREQIQLERERMEHEGIQIKTRSVTSSSTSSETSTAIESAVREVSVRTSSGILIIEYKPDSLRNGVIRKGDTMWVPVTDTAATRPR